MLLPRPCGAFGIESIQRGRRTAPWLQRTGTFTRSLLVWADSSAASSSPVQMPAVPLSGCGRRRSAKPGRRNPTPVVVSKVVILNTGGEDKEIIWYILPLKANNALLRIDAGYFAEENVDVVLAAEYGPERTRNFVCRK